MRTIELEARQRAAAVVSRMLLICCRSMRKSYDRQGNIAAVFPEMLVILAIRINDNRHRPPISAKKIAKVTALPRANVQRWLSILIDQGVVVRSETGYIGDPNYLEVRVSAHYFERLIRAIRSAALMLEDFK
jgi:predicted Rossmann fold nucleotide-binding protein DprA/Smf involved in DNA uptake